MHLELFVTLSSVELLNGKCILDDVAGMTAGEVSYLIITLLTCIAIVTIELKFSRSEFHAQVSLCLVGEFSTFDLVFVQSAIEFSQTYLICISL